MHISQRGSGLMCGRSMRETWRWRVIVLSGRRAVRVPIAIGLLSAAGCIGVPVIHFNPVDQHGVEIDNMQPISVGCLEVEPRITVRKGYWYGPRLTAHLRNPADSGEAVRVVIDSLQLHSLKFNLRRVDVQLPAGTGPDTLVLQPRESARVVIGYIGEWLDGHTNHEVPADERLTIRISGVNCNGDVIPARLLSYEPER